LSTVEGDVSVVANGELKGKSLMEIIEFPAEDIRKAVYKRFGSSLL
jgi:mannose-6-phosphate isomerase